MKRRGNLTERFLYAILLTAAISLTGCGREAAAPERADGAGRPWQLRETPEENTSAGEESSDGWEMQKEGADREQEMRGEENESPVGQAAPEEESRVTEAAALEGTRGGTDAEGTREETDMEDAGEENAGKELEENAGEEPDTEEDIGSTEPELPATGTRLSDFVAEGWELMDSVELDFNEDGIIDYVGVQEVPLDKNKDGWQNDLSLRVLFAIASDDEGQYRLDFQDANLIRARTEGGMMGDPYNGIEGEGRSFTTHTWGGSSDKWTESYTYTYRDGTWYLTASEDCYGYCGNVDDYRRNDWDSGIHIHKTRGRTVNCCHGEYVFDPGVYELEYEMRLDAPLTLYQASRRWWLTQYRITDWEVRDIVFAEGIELPEDRVKKPGWAYYNSGCMDENYAIYSFSDEESEKDYLVLYNRQDKSLAVLAQEDFYKDYICNIDALGVYKDKIYYGVGIVGKVSYKYTRKGEIRTIESDRIVGQKVVRMNLDGTGKETIFTYMYPGAEQTVWEEEPPYIGGIMDFTISGGEIVFGVYISDEDCPYYRMNVDGSKQRKIGQVSHEFPWEEEE